MRKYLKALTNLALALIMFLLIVFWVPRLLWFFAPFVAGAIIAWIAGPMVRFFEEKIKLKRKAGSAFVIIVVIGLVVLLFYLVGARLVEEGVGLLESLPELWESTEEDFGEIRQNLDVVYSRLPKDIQTTLDGIVGEIGSYMGELLGQIGSPTIAAVGNFAKQVPSMIIGLIMALLSAYFFVADRAAVGDLMRSNSPKFLRVRYAMIKHSLKKAVGGYLKAQLKIEIWMYLLLVIGLSILRVNYVLLIALGIAILDLLPFFGTGTVMVPWAIVKILSSDYQMAIGLLIIWGVGQLARQIIQPKIVGDSIGMPPIPTLLLLYVGYKLSGVLGMIVAVPLGLLVYTMYQEGGFDTTRNSLLILVNGVNRFRRLNPSDMEDLQDMTAQEDTKDA